MSFYKKTIRDWDVNGKCILLRADYNVPIDNRGVITSDYRIKQSLPTLQYLIERQAKVIIVSHLGRPKGPKDVSCTLLPVAKKLSELTGQHVAFVDDCIGEKVVRAVEKLAPGSILLLENVRFYKEEEQNDPDFAKSIIESCRPDLFVQDGFGVVHRAHASTEAVAKIVPAVAGLLLENEVDTITNVMQEPKRPLMAIVGGAKIADKIDILHRFVELADMLVIGGAMANTFLLAEDITIGSSLADKTDLPLAKDIMEKARAKAASGTRFIFYLPQDGVVAKASDSTSKTRIVDWSAHVMADIESYPKKPNRDAWQVKSDEKILDIGPFSGAFITGLMQSAETVIWNGSMGVTETPAINGPIGPFSHGSELIVDGLLGQFGNKPFSLIGGGDTVSYIEERGLVESFNHVSTGGGASLELMAGRDLPGVSCLWDK